MFNVECSKRHDRWSLKFLRGMGILVALYFFWLNLLFFLCNYDDFTLKLDREKRSHPDERWLCIDKFNVGSVPGTSFALEASKNI